MSHYTDIRDALANVVDTVSAIKLVLKYEPQSVQDSPLAWVLLDTYKKSTSYQVTAWTFRFRTTVAVPIQNSEEAEDLCIDTAMEVAKAIDQNPQFSGVLVAGLAQSLDGQATWAIVGGTKCRVVDVFCDAVSKRPYGT